MSFSIVRSNQAGCEPFCTEWVYADGKIFSDTPADFQKFLKQSAAKGLPVIIRSDGGDEAAAMALGRIFREKKIEVEVGATLFTGCSTSRFYCRSKLDGLGKYSGFVDVENDYCNSACVLALAGGKRRVANYGNNIRLQNFDDKQGPSREELGKYLDEMGVGRVLITLMEKAKPTELLGLTYDQARAADLVKIRPYGSGLTNAFRCYDAPPPENCVRR
jgi:hypothetical protein